MPKYNYVAMDAHGKETKGTLEVASQNEAIGRVKEMGLFPPRSSRPTRSRKSRAKKGQARPAKGRRQKKGGGSTSTINIKIPGLGGG
jgi:type II secretory pathway component PulF